MGSQGMDVMGMIGGAGFMVQFVLLLLFFFSAASWTIIVVKYRYIRRAFRESAMFSDYFWKSRDLSGAFTKSKQLHGSPIARMFRVGYVELKKLSQSGLAAGVDVPRSQQKICSDNVQRALRRSVNTEVSRMMQMVPFLATTGNTTPFIGLFGTVWGIMNAFHGIGQRGSASLAVVAPGISEALIATAAGLAVAIPAVIAFNYFMQKIRIIETELHSFSADFLNIIERDLLSHSGGD